MGYLHINNLYKDQFILQHKEVYALEKIHGTSAHIRWDKKDVSFFSGGADYYTFRNLFDYDNLMSTFSKLFSTREVIIYGEAYGGKMHRMADTYGPALKFVAFDVKIDGNWLNVPNAQTVVSLSYGLEFVDYVKIPTNLPDIDYQRDRDSVQAIRNGMGPGKLREGIVLRPIIETVKSNLERLIVKHKRPEFSETKTIRKVDESKVQEMKDAQAIAEDWVTDMRLSHVLDKCLTPEENSNLDMTYTPRVIRAMLEDVQREGQGEIEWTASVSKEIGKRTAQIFKQKVQKIQ